MAPKPEVVAPPQAAPLAASVPKDIAASETAAVPVVAPTPVTTTPDATSAHDAPMASPKAEDGSASQSAPDVARESEQAPSDLPTDAAHEGTPPPTPANAIQCSACDAHLMAGAHYCAMCAYPTERAVAVPARKAPAQSDRRRSDTQPSASGSSDASRGDQTEMLRTIGPRGAPVVDILANETVNPDK